MQPQDQPGTHTRAVYIPGQATAGTADIWPLFAPQDNIKVTGIRWTPAAAVTGDNTNYYSAAFQNRGTDGTGTTAITTTKAYTTNTNSVAHDTEAFTLHATAANHEVDAGEVIALVRTVTASGLAMPDGLVEIDFRYV